MSIPSDPATGPAIILPSNASIPDVYQQGIVAGVIGAATIAVWFFLIDFLAGRAMFYTPNVLGAALFQRGAGLERPETLAISFELVLAYTWVHGLLFCAIGGLAAKLLDLAERSVHAGFGIILLFVIFEFGFVAAASVFAEPILHALAWPAVLLGNLLAAAAMAVYFWNRHAGLKIDP